MLHGAALVSASTEQLPPAPKFEQVATDVRPALTPHRYPAWVLLFGLGVLAMTAVAVRQLPPYYQAATLLQRAQTLAEHGEDKAAIALFTDALRITPGSRRARIGVSILYFRSPDGEDHEKAMDAIQGMTFDKDEWAKLVAVIPPDYRSQFKEVKK